jgi:hypothetical protein
VNKQKQILSGAIAGSLLIASCGTVSADDTEAARSKPKPPAR